MDLHLTAATASVSERAAVDALLGPPETHWQGGARQGGDDSRQATGGHAARARRHLLLPALHAVRDAVGWVSEGAVNYIALRLTVPPAEIFGVASFYALFDLTETPPTVLHVCDDIACTTAGAGDRIATLERTHGPEGRPCAGGRATWKRSPCLGLCERAPAALVQRAGEGRTDTTIAAAGDALLEAALAGGAGTPRAFRPLPQSGEGSLTLLRRVGECDPGSLAEYRARGGYKALQRAFELGPGGVIREVIAAKLLGRGGAAFPTGVKWDAVAKAAARPHHVVCNADESEPGTFKDRVLMEEDPFALIEAMTIAGYATGAETGWIYIRGEYPEAHVRLAHAVAQARRTGLLGPALAGHEDVAFDIELRRGAGAYICGEETALCNSIEGYRGEPRNKPPFPVHEGLFGKPTAINNVETLVNVLEIVRTGGAAWAATGTEGSRGPKLFCVSGCVAVPGLYEMPFGITLRELLARAGGPRPGRTLRAVLLGGAAGSFVTPAQFDMPLTFEGTRAAGASLGSGVVLAFDETVDMQAIVLRIARFFRDESCGQCVPCRVGTVRQQEALVRLAGGGAGRDRELALLDELDRAMRDASICGLGHTAAIAVRSAIETLGLFGGEGPVSAPAARPAAAPVRTLAIQVDGARVEVPEGATLLTALRSAGADTPTLCFLETLAPVNACRVCVVELEGARTLVPSCSRRAEEGMVVRTDSERVRHARKLVFELLGSSVDLSLAGPEVKRWMERYGADPARFGAPAPAAPGSARDAAHAGHHHAPHGSGAQTVAQPAKVDNDLYVRDYSRCILCYKCVEACGEDAQNTFAITVAGRGFDARISTEFAVPLTDSACVYCGNCIGVCPTGALMFKSEHDMRAARTWDEPAQTVTRTVCTYCGVGCNLDLHVQDNTIVKVTSPMDHDVTSGHLCIKGRFGFEFVQVRERGGPQP